MDKLKLYMFATEQHVFIHFMKFPAILVQVYFLPPPPPPHTHWPNSEKTIFSWIYPFHEISCRFGSGVFLPPSPPPPPSPHPLAKQWKKNFFIDLSISWYFLQFWFRCILTPPPPPPPPPNSEKKFFFFFSWIYPFHEISCNFGSGVFFSWIYPFLAISCLWWLLRADMLGSGINSFLIRKGSMSRHL